MSVSILFLIKKVTSNHEYKKGHNKINIEIMINTCRCSCRYGWTITKEQTIDNDSSNLP